MTVYILPHKKSLKGTSYAKQVAKRLYVVKGVTEFQMRQVPYKVRAQRVSLPVFTVLKGGGAEELWPGALLLPLSAGREVWFPVIRQSSRPRVVTQRCPYQDVAK